MCFNQGLRPHHLLRPHLPRHLRSRIAHSQNCCPRHLCLRPFRGILISAMESCSRHGYAQESQKQLMHFVRSSCSNMGWLDRAHCFPRSTKMQVQVQSCAATARLAWRLRLHSCLGLSELRGSSCMLCARPFSKPWCASLGPAEKNLSGVPR